MENIKDGIVNGIQNMSGPMLEALGKIVADFLPIILVLSLIEIAILIFKHLAGESDRNIKQALMDDYDLEDGDEIDWETLENIADSYFFYDLDTGEYLDYEDEEDDE